MESSTETPTTPTKPLEVARAIFDALSKRDLDAVGEFLNDDTVDDFVAIGLVEGRAAIRTFFDTLLTAFPDFEMSVERIVGDKTTAVVQWHAAGTFSGGPFQGVDPTGKHVDVRGVDVMEIAQGRVKHNTIYYDGAAFARQIGLLPAEGSATEKAMVSAFNAATKLRKAVRR
ncbi:MAG TPA: ester cyclase [Acidimicrobiales bacterium]|nr:ester cyclase [Acidimicrobiales bacterium]